MLSWLNSGVDDCGFISVYIFRLERSGADSMGLQVLVCRRPRSTEYAPLHIMCNHLTQQGMQLFCNFTHLWSDWRIPGAQSGTRL